MVDFDWIVMALFGVNWGLFGLDLLFCDWAVGCAVICVCAVVLVIALISVVVFVVYFVA